MGEAEDVREWKRIEQEKERDYRRVMESMSGRGREEEGEEEDHTRERKWTRGRGEGCERKDRERARENDRVKETDRYIARAFDVTFEQNEKGCRRQQHWHQQLEVHNPQSCGSSGKQLAGLVVLFGMFCHSFQAGNYLTALTRASRYGKSEVGTEELMA